MVASGRPLLECICASGELWQLVWNQLNNPNMSEEPIKIFYSWECIEIACMNMYAAINESGFKPDYIVGLTRGGLVPAVIFSHKFNVPLHTLNVSLRDNHSKERRLWMIEDALHSKNILIVDDINDSGSTINTIKANWEEAFPGDWHKIWHNNVRFAVIDDNMGSAVRTDYCNFSIDKNKNNNWIVYPWENNE